MSHLRHVFVRSTIQLNHHRLGLQSLAQYLIKKLQDNFLSQVRHEIVRLLAAGGVRVGVAQENTKEDQLVRIEASL